jgi:DNA mismatch endonuclease (patch repair protein)
MDKISKEQRRKNMQAIRSKNTKPEMTVRKLIFSLGYRYRLHGKNLPGKPDLVFPSRKKAIYVNGCFWHQHDDPNCKLSRLPKSNLEFWLPKLERTKARDREHLVKLAELGWEYLTIWECDLKNTEKITCLIRTFLDK